MYTTRRLTLRATLQAVKARPIKLKHSSAVCLLFFIHLTASNAGAQQHPPHFEFFGEVGGSFLTGGNGSAPVPLNLIPCPAPPASCPTGNLTGSFSNTARLFAGFRFRATPRHAFEAGYSFSPNRFKVFDKSISLLDIGPGYDRVSFFNFNYVGYLIARGPFEPFVTAGIGVNRFSQASQSNGNQAGFNLGGGADVVLARSFALRLELRDFMTGQPSPIRGTVHDFVPSAGLVFRFP